MTTVSSLLRRVGVAFALGLLGLTMVLWELEGVLLANAAATLAGALPQRSWETYLLLFLGLVLVSLNTMWASRLWTGYVREHPDSGQLPVWFLVLLILLPAVVFLGSVVTHAGYLSDLDEVPLDPNFGYVGFQVVAVALVIVASVLLAVRRRTRPRA